MFDITCNIKVAVQIKNNTFPGIYNKLLFKDIGFKYSTI